MVAEAKDLRAFLHGECVVDGDSNCAARSVDDLAKHTLADNVGAPTAAREKSVIRLPMTAAGDIRRHQRSGHRVRSLRQHPAAEHDNEVDKTGTCQRGTEAVFPDLAQPAI